MDSLNLLFTLGVILYIGGLMYAANVEVLRGSPAVISRVMTFGLVGGLMLYGLAPLQTLLPGFAPDEGLAITPAAAVSCAAIAGVTAALSLAYLLSPGAREWARRLTGPDSAYQAQSPLHQAAVVLCLSLLAFTLMNLALGGGLSGIAQDIAESGGISLGEAALNQVLWVLAALLGVGLFIRRTTGRASDRLATRTPTLLDVRTGVIGAGVMLAIVFSLSVVWGLLASPETIAEQTAASAEVADSFDTLPTVFLVSLLVAIGEEVFFRGALQRVFGLWLTALFFAALHTQYTLTPASIGIVAVAVVLGIIAKRSSTTGAIIAHFTFNFTQLALALLASSLVGR